MMVGPSVAHVVLALDPGGTERLVIDLAIRSSRQLAATRVYCLDRPGDWAQELTDRGISVDVVGRQPGRDWGVAWRLRRLSSAHGVTVLHCHQYTPFVYGAIAALLRPGLRLVFTEHGRLSDAAPSRHRAVANRLLGAVPAVITAVSEELREFMIAEGFSPGRVEVVHNGIDPGLPPTSSDRVSARDRLQVMPTDFVIGSVARLDRVKNLTMALTAFAAVRAAVPNAVLVIVGDGPERAALEGQTPPAAGAVRWLGYRPDVRSLLPGMDAYVNTSVSEGISVTILEAMAAGVPVVATAVGGTPEVIVSEACGLLVGTRDAVECARALERLAADESLRARFGAAGRERVKTHFSVDRMARRYAAAYRRDRIDSSEAS